MGQKVFETCRSCEPKRSKRRSIKNTNWTMYQKKDPQTGYSGTGPLLLLPLQIT